MHRTWVIWIGILFMLLQAGCGNVADDSSKVQPNSQITQEKQKEDTTSAAKTTQSQLVCTVPGLGDTMDGWTKQYGTPVSKGDTLKVFKNGSYVTVFENNRANNVTFYSTKDGQHNPLIVKMLPRDGDKRSETSRKVGEGKIIVQKWHSQLLETAIPATKGNYTVIDNYDSQSYVSTVADCTPDLKK
jgi:hypothetical protein